MNRLGSNRPAKEKKKRLKRKERNAAKNGSKTKVEDLSDDEPEFKFRYRTVPANNYGLTVDEIMNTEDSQLNKWAPVHKVSAYKSNEEEEKEIQYFQRKAQNIEKKKKILAPLPTTKTKKEDGEVKEDTSEVPTLTPKTKKQQHKKNRKEQQQKKKVAVDLDDDRLRSYGVSVKKLKRLRYNKKQDQKKEAKEKEKLVSSK